MIKRLQDIGANSSCSRGTTYATSVNSSLWRTYACPCEFVLFNVPWCVQIFHKCDEQEPSVSRRLGRGGTNSNWNNSQLSDSQASNSTTYMLPRILVQSFANGASVAVETATSSFEFDPPVSQCNPFPFTLWWPAMHRRVPEPNTAHFKFHIL